jgi:hypothetical protein
MKATIDVESDSEIYLALFVYLKQEFVGRGHSLSECLHDLANEVADVERISDTAAEERRRTGEFRDRLLHGHV